MRNDVSFVLIMVAFFAVAALFVIACDKLIGPDDEALGLGEDAEEVETEEVAT